MELTKFWKMMKKELDENFVEFQQDGDAPHFSQQIGVCLEQYPIGRWISKRRPDSLLGIRF